MSSRRHYSPLPTSQQDEDDASSSHKITIPSAPYADGSSISPSPTSSPNTTASNASNWLSSQLSKFNATWLLESQGNASLRENYASSAAGADDENQDSSHHQQPSILEELDIHPTQMLYQLYTILIYPFLQQFFANSSIEKKLRGYVLLEDDFWGAAFIIALFSVFVLHKGWRLVTWVYFIWLLGSLFIWFLVMLLAIPSREDMYSGNSRDAAQTGRDTTSSGASSSEYHTVNMDDLDNFTFEENQDVQLDDDDLLASSQQSPQSAASASFDAAQREEQKRAHRENQRQLDAIGSVSYSAVLSIIGYALLPIAICDASIKFLRLFIEIETVGTSVAIFCARLITWIHSTYVVSYVLIQADKVQQQQKRSDAAAGGNKGGILAASFSDNSSLRTTLQSKRWMLYWPVSLIFLYFISLN